MAEEAKPRQTPEDPDRHRRSDTPMAIKKAPRPRQGVSLDSPKRWEHNTLEKKKLRKNAASPLTGKDEGTKPKE